VEKDVTLARERSASRIQLEALRSLSSRHLRASQEEASSLRTQLQAVTVVNASNELVLATQATKITAAETALADVNTELATRRKMHHVLAAVSLLVFCAFIATQVVLVLHPALVEQLTLMIHASLGVVPPELVTPIPIISPHPTPPTKPPLLRALQTLGSKIAVVDMRVHLFLHNFVKAFGPAFSSPAWRAVRRAFSMRIPQHGGRKTTIETDERPSGDVPRDGVDAAARA